ncbi:hypothetical protein [Serratia fonticola]|uniref:hypothetical protein n=1 Tax=Serratia fonticola TaxID=47917 RepID=UPI00192CF5C0|nr:hypothetical protein [Serratia fonticola]MBL5824963.1 hypothetical protein [Serratia fonticola]
MKIKITLMILLITLVLCSLFYYQHQKKLPFRCDTQFISHIEHNGSKLDLNLNANIIFTLRNEGILSFTGSVKQDGHEYLVVRRLFFTTTPSELDGIDRTKITREEISPNNQLPEEVWKRYVIQGTLFYTQMTPVNSNGVLLQDLSNPFFICARSES